jgi:phage-related minor tail protein
LQGLYKKAIYVLLNGFYHQSDRIAEQCFCMLISAKHNSVAAGFSEVRSSLSHNLRDINYAARLWQVFKAIISGALNELKELLGDAVTLVIETIEKHINCFQGLDS